jgi:hypothetical protein
MAATNEIVGGAEVTAIRRNEREYVAAMMNTSQESAESLRQIKLQAGLELEWRRGIRRNEGEYVVATMDASYDLCHCLLRRIFF